MTVVDSPASSKNKSIKGTSQDWFDAEIVKQINERDKLFKKSCFHVDNDNYKEARNKLQKLTRTKKNVYIESQVTENIGKAKELWKILKYLFLKFESSISNVNWLENVVFIFQIWLKIL